MDMKNVVILDKLVRQNTLLKFKFNSSAQDLEKDLKKFGPMPVQLYYEYKLPRDQNPRQFEYLVQTAVYVLSIFNPQQILDPDAYYADMLTRRVDFIKQGGPISNEVLEEIINGIQQDLNATEKDLAGLDVAQRQGLVKYIESRCDNLQAEIVTAVAWLKQNNPNLQNVRVDMNSFDSIVSFLEGVTYGFAPEEIDYFLNSDMHSRNKDKEKNYKALESFGIHPMYMLRPDRAEKIVNTIQNQMAQVRTQKYKD